MLSVSYNFFFFSSLDFLPLLLCHIVVVEWIISDDPLDHGIFKLSRLMLGLMDFGKFGKFIGSKFMNVKSMKL